MAEECHLITDITAENLRSVEYSHQPLHANLLPEHVRPFCVSCIPVKHVANGNADVEITEWFVLISPLFLFRSSHAYHQHIRIKRIDSIMHLVVVFITGLIQSSSSLEMLLTILHKSSAFFKYLALKNVVFSLYPFENARIGNPRYIASQSDGLVPPAE